MKTENIFRLIDEQILRLQQARELLASGTSSTKRKLGRPKGHVKTKRVFSPEARAKMAAAQKKRWAKQRK